LFESVAAFANARELEKLDVTFGPVCGAQGSGACDRERR
jgi:hypothetical protein